MHRKTERRELRRVLILIGILLTLLIFSGCVPSSPTYPFDIFSEMHYSPAYLPEEPPRLAPPEDAVPITGRAPKLSQSQARQLQNPMPRTAENMQRANELYHTNCRPCHGSNGRGDGFVAPYFQRAGLPTPVDFTSAFTRGLTDGEIYAIIGNGLDGMPPFGNLLSSDERWLLVHFIRSVSAEAR